MLTINATTVKTSKHTANTVRQTRSVAACQRPSFLILLMRALSAFNV